MVSIDKLKITPNLNGNSEFNREDENIQSISIVDNLIKIRFKDDSPFEYVHIPIDGLIEIKLKNDPKWDVRFCSFLGDIDIYYKLSPYPIEAMKAIMNLN